MSKQGVKILSKWSQGDLAKKELSERRLESGEEVNCGNICRQCSRQRQGPFKICHIYWLKWVKAVILMLEVLPLMLPRKHTLHTSLPLPWDQNITFKAEVNTQNYPMPWSFPFSFLTFNPTALTVTSVVIWYYYNNSNCYWVVLSFDRWSS